jgi:hypothetical protein
MNCLNLLTNAKKNLNQTIEKEPLIIRQLFKIKYLNLVFKE